MLESGVGLAGGGGGGGEEVHGASQEYMCALSHGTQHSHPRAFLRISAWVPSAVTVARRGLTMYLWIWFSGGWIHTLLISK